MGSLKFVVFGRPEPKGSAKAFLPKGWTRPVVTSDNPKIKGWQKAVGFAALDAIKASGVVFPFVVGPVQAELIFWLQRPKALKGSAKAHTTRPDLDKLVRCVCDALTGICWTDDSQVSLLMAHKLYAEPGTEPRLEVTLAPAPGKL